MTNVETLPDGSLDTITVVVIVGYSVNSTHVYPNTPTPDGDIAATNKFKEAIFVYGNGRYECTAINVFTGYFNHDEFQVYMNTNDEG